MVWQKNKASFNAIDSNSTFEKSGHVIKKYCSQPETENSYH